MTAQLIHDLPSAEYHQRKLGLCSKTALDRINRSPSHYREWLDGPDEDTPAFVFGRAFHCAVLEPDVFREQYVQQPSFGDLRTKAAKADRDAWRSDNAGKVALSVDDWGALASMQLAVLRHPLASRILRNGQAEVSARWTDERTGLQCQCRADYHVPGRALIADLKSTFDASREGFRKSVANYRYHVQDAHYSAGFEACGAEIRHFLFIAVEKTPPYAVAVYSLDAEARGRGIGAVRRNLETMAECMQTDTWPGYPTTIQELDLPPWAD